MEDDCLLIVIEMFNLLKINAQPQLITREFILEIV